MSKSTRCRFMEAAQCPKNLLLRTITNQNGFRKQRSTIPVPQILDFALRRIIEEFKIGKISAAIVFVDFCKCNCKAFNFNSIKRKALYHILGLYDMIFQLLSILLWLYVFSMIRRTDETIPGRTPNGPTHRFGGRVVNASFTSKSHFGLLAELL